MKEKEEEARGENENGKSATLDDVLGYLGWFGRANILNYALLLAAVVLTGCYASVYNFEAINVDYRCSISECSNEDEILDVSMAWSEVGEPSSVCERYDRTTNITSTSENGTLICMSSDFNSSVVIPCTSFHYYENHSIVSEFNLGCQEWRRTLAGTVHNAGFFVSIPLTGVVSDRWGRKPALLLASLANGFFGLLRAFAPNYTAFIILEFLEPALGAGAYTAAFVLAMEMAGPRGRVLVSLLMNLCFITGGVTVTLLARWLLSWRRLLLVCYTPALLALAAVPLLTESPRWLFSKAKIDKAINILEKSARMNKKTLPEGHLKELATQSLKQLESDKPEGSSEARQLVRSWLIWRRCMICSFLWATCTLVYYGLSINAVALAGDPYINYIIVLVVEIPANCCKLLLLDRFGRKGTIAPAFLLSGAILLCYAFIPAGVWPLVFYLGGKFFITLAYNSLYVFVAEVFPTTFRASLLSLCSTIGRIGSALAPQTPLLSAIYEFLPTMVFGSMALVSAGLVLALPETLRRPLPDSLAHAKSLSASNADDKKNCLQTDTHNASTNL